MKNLFICPKSITLHLDGNVSNTVPFGAILSIGNSTITLYTGAVMNVRCEFSACWNRIDPLFVWDEKSENVAKRPSSYKYIKDNRSKDMAYLIDGKEVPQEKYDEFIVRIKKMQSLYIIQTIEKLREKLNMYYDKINC